MKKIFSQLYSLEKYFALLLSFLFFFFQFALPVSAQGPQPWSARGLDCVGTGDASDVATIQGFGCLIANVLSIAITAIGLVAFVMFIVASFRYLLSGGNSKNTEMARGTITYAIAGIVVALSAFIILNLISNFTGVDVTQFVIPGASP